MGILTWIEPGLEEIFPRRLASSCFTQDVVEACGQTGISKIRKPHRKISWFLVSRSSYDTEKPELSLFWTEELGFPQKWFSWELRVTKNSWAVVVVVRQHTCSEFVEFTLVNNERIDTRINYSSVILDEDGDIKGGETANNSSQMRQLTLSIPRGHEWISF